MTISEREKICLKILFDANEADYYNDEYGWTRFKYVAEKSKLTLSQARRSVRALARKGLAEFSQLFDDEGYLNGSGYHISREGINLLKN